MKNRAFLFVVASCSFLASVAGVACGIEVRGAPEFVRLAGAELQGNVAASGAAAGAVLTGQLSAKVLESKTVFFQGPAGVLRSVVYNTVHCRVTLRFQSPEAPDWVIEEELVATQAPGGDCPLTEMKVLVRKAIGKIPTCQSQ
ncbi:MAG: hypothetical protein HUU37_07990 [Bdellovibrionales bacterium]|nr:hypothetical protein [Bdellovibrionales bacterium]